MRFLANENFPGPSVALLRSAGHEVVYIAEDFPGISDLEVIELAVNSDLVILTFDRDYGEIIFTLKVTSPPAVIFFRYKGVRPDYAGKILLQQIEGSASILVKSFTVVDFSGIRSRPY